jgi:hypothetical protein
MEVWIKKKAGLGAAVYNETESVDTPASKHVRKSHVNLEIRKAGYPRKRTVNPHVRHGGKTLSINCDRRAYGKRISAARNGYPGFNVNRIARQTIEIAAANQIVYRNSLPPDGDAAR